jgi:hypothetical protein
MSEPAADPALHDRFDVLHTPELERLKGIMGGLTEADRQFVHQITSDVVDALAHGPERALAEDPTLIAIAVLRLFALKAEA